MRAAVVRCEPQKGGRATKEFPEEEWPRPAIRAVHLKKKKKKKECKGVGVVVVLAGSAIIEETTAAIGGNRNSTAEKS